MFPSQCQILLPSLIRKPFHKKRPRPLFVGLIKYLSALFVRIRKTIIFLKFLYIFPLFRIAKPFIALYTVFL